MVPLAKVPASELGATVIKALLEETGVKPEQISEVILGQAKLVLDRTRLSSGN